MIPGIVASQQAAAVVEDPVEPDDEDSAGGTTFADVVFLSSFDGVDGATSTTDDSNSAHAISFQGNAQLDTAQKKFGTASLLLDGAGDWIQCANHADFLFGAGPFTVEGFVRIADVASEIGVFVSMNDITPAQEEISWRILFAAGALLFQYSTNGADTVTPINVASGMSNNTQHHWAAERNDAGLVRVYVDGAVVGSATVTASFFASTKPLTIGADTAGNAPLAGHIDEVRITRGAWYDGAFTPPAAPFPRS